MNNRGGKKKNKQMDKRDRKFEIIIENNTC